MIIPDVNLLLYAVIDGFSEHASAKTWWEESVNGAEQVGLAPVVVTGFIRLATNPRLFDVPLRIDAATGYVREWIDLPGVEVLAAGRPHVIRAMDLVERAGTAGNLTTDAQIAAHALDHHATVYSNDADFGRFADIEWVNPLATPR